MIDTVSIDSLIRSLPKIPKTIEGPFLLKTRLASAIAPAAASLAQRGFLGCLPFAHHKANEVVLPLRPGVPLARTPVAVAFWSFTEGLTISCDLAHFVAGRLAQLDASTQDRLLDDTARSALLALADELGGEIGRQSVERVLQAAPRTRTLREQSDRMAALWAACDPDLPFFQLRNKAWTLSGANLGDWLDGAVRRFPDDELVARLYVSHHMLNRTGVDVTDAAWTVVTSDAVFDATFNGASTGPSFNVWRYAPLVHAAKWLESRSLGGLDERRRLSLAAASAFAREPKTYAGVDHLEAARTLAADAPELAWTHAATAAAFYVRATKKTPAASIVLGEELARTNGWSDLATVMRWTRDELEA